MSSRPLTSRSDESSAALDVLRSLCAALVPFLLLATPATAQFVTFETGQVRPLALAVTPDGLQLFAVNTPDNRLEIFNVNAGTLAHVGAVPVGMEPIAVAVRPNGNEVWVVNHLSDSVSVIDLTASPPAVVRTLLVGDEPRDIVFAGPGGNRAFITTAHRGQNTSLQATIDTVLRTEGIGRADVWVFDADNLGATLGGTPLAGTPIVLFTDTPRALAVSADGNTVYAAAFHSGNQTTAVIEPAVCDGGAAEPPCNLDGVTMPNGLPGGQVPGGLPAPNQNLDGDPGPEVGLIVKFNNGNSRWEDQSARNWTNAVRFSLPDTDVFAINAAATPPVQSASFARVGTVIFNMIANPTDLPPDPVRVYVTNTEARNEVRFEGPGGGGSTVRGHLHEARITVLNGSTVTPRHLNKHITALPQGYGTVPMPAGIDDDSLATPLGMAITSDGATLYVAAFGSSKIGVFSTALLENNTFTPDEGAHITVPGGGPTGLVLDEVSDRLYVLARFDNSISVINTNTNLETQHLPLYNPEPASVVTGRPVLYDARFTSSNGEASCSSCHIFGDFDSLAWDLGNPDDVVVSNPNPGVPPPAPFFSDDFHPMKGPMTTQTLRGMAHHGPMHWRGDRTGAYADPNIEPDSGAFDEDAAFKEFQVAFDGLLGRDEGPLPETDMQAFTDFILQVTLPPNPIRDLSNDLAGASLTGFNIFTTTPATDGVTTCEGCHGLNASQGFFGANGRSTFESETQEFKVPHLRNLYQKVGMFGLPGTGLILPGNNGDQGPQVRGFGFLHDGGIDTIFRFHRAVVFNSLNDTQRQQLESFMFRFDSTVAPIVGQQITLTSTNGGTVGGRIDLLIDSAEDLFTVQGVPGAHECDLVVKGVVENVPLGVLEQRGAVYNPATDRFQPDRASDPTLTDAQLRALIDTVDEFATYTCAPPGSGTRMGVDRDEDTFFDTDEIDAGSDPADPSSIPGGGPTPTCAATPVTGCHAAGKSLLLIRTASGKEKLVWRWLKGVMPLDQSAFGDPTSSTGYALCVYTGTEMSELNVPPGGSAWTTSSSGFKYTDSSLAQDGVRKILLKAGEAGKGKVLVRGRGASLPLPPVPPGGYVTPVTVQLTNGIGQCWEGVYNQFIKNDGTQFKAKF